MLYRIIFTLCPSKATEVGIFCNTGYPISWLRTMLLNKVIIVFNSIFEGN